MDKIKFFLVFVLVFFIPSPAFAHVCDDVLRHDPIVIWPERETVEIEKTGQFKIFLRNDYWGSIHRVKLVIPESPFKIWATPSLYERVAPGEKIFFLVHLTIPEKMRPGAYPLLIKIDAQEFEITRDINLTIRVKEPPVPAEPLPKPEPKPLPEPKPEPLPEPEPQADIEIIPEQIPVAVSVLPDEINVEPGQTVEFRVYLRLGYDKPLHNITLLIDKIVFEVFKFNLAVHPEIIQKLEPGETRFFVVNLEVPAQVKMGEYIMPINFKAAEFPIERHACNVLVRVGKVWGWKTYLYLLIILFILVIAIWLTLKRKKLKAKY